MKNKVRILSSLLIALSSSILAGCDVVSDSNDTSSEVKEENYAIKLKKLYDGKSTSTLDPTISRYIRNYDNVEYLAEALADRRKELKENGRSRYDYQTIKIEWEDTNEDESFTVHVADNKEFNNEYTYTTTNNSVSREIGMFIPKQTYYYKVVGSKTGESKVDSFIANASVRYITADTVINVRDIGGWETADGKTLNYGKIYRGGALNEGPNASYLSDESRRMFNYLGIKGELDLRGKDKAGSEASDLVIDDYVNQINPDYPVLRKDLVHLAYEQMTNDEGRAKNNLPKIFHFLADENNYPVYFHCSVGADRTGTLGYILEALCGVDFEHLMIDYELTSFTTDTTGGIRSRSTIEETTNGYKFANPSEADLASNSKLWYAHNLLMNKYKDYSTDLSKVMEKYLIDMGVKKTDIDIVKSILLD